MNDRILRQIDSDYMRGGASQYLAAISFTASNVQNALLATELRRPVITVKVFQLDFTSNLGYIALTSPWKVARRSVGRH
jgi:hypothetical protein